MSRPPITSISIMTYLILFLVAAYLFKVNPVLCVGLVGAVVFFKVRGFFGGRNSRNRTRDPSTASQAALVALCLSFLERSNRGEQPSRVSKEDTRDPVEDDPLEGLFIN